MPTYVYECRVCEKQFEVDQRISEDPLTDCSCGAKGGLKRVIQPTAIMFKGSGFHINDYAPSAKADAASSGDGGTSAGSAASEGSQASAASVASAESTTPAAASESAAPAAPSPSSGNSPAPGALDKMH